MLYVTTRNKSETFTAQRVLREKRGPDGGEYLPFQIPALADLEPGTSINHSIAQVLNLLFQTRLTAWDVDFTIGRYPVRLEFLRQRTIMAEPWHNPHWDFAHLAESLLPLIGAAEKTGWTDIAIRVAVLTGIFGELERRGIQEKVDVAVVSGDFAGPISAWYARQWGLPVGNIICCCNENNAVWDLLTYGQIRTDAVSILTQVPEADVVVPDHLERLIDQAGGREEVLRYLDCCRRGGMYCPEAEALSAMSEGLYASVVSSQRLSQTILGAYTTHGYVMPPASALAYAGLLDHRARTGTLRPALVMTEKAPSRDSGFIAGALGMTAEQANEII